MSSGQPSPEPGAAPVRPLLRVVRGAPTPEELAALVTVLSAAASSSGPAAGRPPATSSWNDRARAVRAPLSPGPNAWRASALPS